MTRYLSTFLCAALVAAGLAAGHARAQRPRQDAGRLRLTSWDAKALETLQRSRDAGRRVEAARQLARSGNPQLIQVLAHYAAYDQSYDVREAASHAVARLRRGAERWEAPEPPRIGRRDDLVDEKFADDRERAREAQDAIEALRSERQAHRREDAARALGRVGGPGAIELLAHAAAYDPDPTVRLVATRAVERIRERADRWAPPDRPEREVEAYEPQPVEVPVWGEYRQGPPRGDDTADLIQLAAAHYLNRDLAPQEVRDWLDHFRRRGDYWKMLHTFLASEEYFRRSNNDPRVFVRRLYADVLRREPDEAGYRNWLRVFDQGRGDRNRFVQQFLETSQREFQQKGYRY
jgi:Domain of unknown function (DUF4214)